MRTTLSIVCTLLFCSNLSAQSHSLLPQFHGMTGVTWTTPLIADSLPAVDAYEFEVATAGGLFLQVVGASDNVLTLSETSLGSELQREITVRVRTISGGQSSAFGDAVTFTTEGPQMLFCGDGPDVEELLNDYPDFEEYRQWREEQVQGKLLEVATYRGGGGCQVSYTIPVVFHIVHDGTAITDVPDSFILDQLQAMNDEFSGPNANTLGGNPCIQFCLAQNAPGGQDWQTDFGSITPGITRSNNPVASVHFMSNASQVQLTSVVNFPPDQYLNVWVVSEIEDGPLGIAGYATPPGSALPLDGIVIEHPIVAGYGGVFGYEEGYAMVHELGHYLGLFHTFWNGCSPLGDFCDDTPPVAQFNMGSCIDLTPLSCGVPEQLENHMDYTFDLCKSTFTEDQIQRMHGHLLAFRATLIQTANHVNTGIAGPTGCLSDEIAALFTSNGTQFCSGTSTATFTGTSNYDDWTFTFFNPDGIIPSVSGTAPPVPSASVTFPNPGAWVVSLSVSNTSTPPLGTANMSQTVYVSDCGGIIMEQGNWHFGQFCALDFTSGIAVPATSSINALEGTASMSNALTGTTEFYAGNNQAFNSGGVGLNPLLDGGPLGSSSQGVIAVPDPGNPDRYYLFTTSEYEPGNTVTELHYSIIDMTLTLGGSTGDFVPGMVNVSVGAGEPLTTEHLSAVPHCNGVDYWILVHGADDTSFDQLIAYHLTSTGIVGSVVSQAFPVVPWTTTPLGLGSRAGHIKFNREGDMAAITRMGGTGPGDNLRGWLYAFDRESGQFTFLANLPNNTTNGYGLSFSRSGNFLYTRTTGGLWQHDLRSFDACDPVIPNNSHPFLVATPGIAAISLGPDDKVYVGLNLPAGHPEWLAVVNYPEVWNDTPNAFGFHQEAIDLDIPGNGIDERFQIGLPNMIDARPTPGQIDFTWCGTDCENVTFSLIGCGASINWDVDCNSTVEGTENVFTHAFPTPGSYCVSLTVDGVTVTHTVDILIPPTPDIDPDVVCIGGPVTFTTTNTAGLSHSWSLTGNGLMTGPGNEPSTEIWWTGIGTLTLEVTDAVTGCANSVTLPIAPVTYQPDAGPDATVCVGEALMLGDNLGTAMNCTWLPTSNLNIISPCSPVFTSTTAGTYAYTVHAIGANGCVGSDEVVITVVDSQCDVLTLAKWATPNNPAHTYAGAPVMFTIQACNNDVVDQLVEIADEMPPGFVHMFTTGFIPTGNPPDSPYWPAATITIPAGECITTEITGYFTEIGEHTNTVILEQEPGVSLNADATITLLDGCPMIVYGNGGCEPGQIVDMCLGMHTQLTDVESVVYYMVYPDFLVPPPSGPLNVGTTITAPPSIQPFISAATMGASIPLAWVPGYNAVLVEVFFNPPVSPSPPYQFFCIDFTIGTAGVPAGTNAVWTWASTTAPSNSGWNRTTVNTTGGSMDLWTQAYHILFTGCPDIPTPNAEFTVDVPNCGGAVTVTADLNDPDAIHIWTWGDDRTTPINGAPSWTYDYFGPITDNQGWPVNIPPADPGTYTITHTVVLNGVAHSSTQQITIYACCEAATVVEDGDQASAIGTFFTGSVDIRGQFIVDMDVTFSNAQVSMEPGSEIIVQTGVNLFSDNSEFFACDGVMWRSITANDGCIVIMTNSLVTDAEEGLKALNSAILWVDGSEFRDNRVAITVPDQGQFNSVGIYMANSTIHAPGPLAQPYQGQASTLGQQGFAALHVHDMTLDFNGGNNLIHSLSNGIVARRSDVSVSGVTMLNIQPDAAYAYVGNGAGIYANGSGSWSTVKQQGYGMNSTPSFQNCRWGIYTEYMNVRSTDNHMVDMGTAYRVDRSGYRSVDILENQVYTRFNGIDLRSNDGAAHILVQNNDITFGDDPSCTACRGWYAIYIGEGNYAAPDSRVQNNSIHFLSQYASRYGIGLFAADRWVVAENELNLVNNAFNRTGIWLSGCRTTEVSCNTVYSSDANYPVDAQAAIRNIMGREPLISCNEMDQTANGILFNGVAYNTDVRGNQFHNHSWPLHLDATAIIDAQTLKGNLWDPNANTPVWGAWYEVSSWQAGNSLFLYDPATIGIGVTTPPSWSPPNWFNVTSGPNYDCADHHGMHYCSQFDGERCKDCIRELDEKIASDSLENNPYTGETKWMLKGDLYKKLDDAPSLLDSLPELDAFYASLQGSTTAAFKAIADDQLALYGLDSTVVAHLQANRTQIEALMALVKDGMEQLGDETLTPAQRQTILGGISGYRQNINNLTIWNATALQVASASKVLTADGVKAANSGLATSELIEANEKAVTDIYLAIIGKDVDTFSSTQADDLFTIANQCPMLGGNAVFKARSLYWLIDDSYDFDDQLLCLPHGIVVKSLMTQPVNSITVVPNPANDEATLVLDQALDEPGVFIVFDAVGAIVMQQVVPMEMPRTVFSTASLAPAIYYYQVRGPSGVIGVGKLTIVR